MTVKHSVKQFDLQKEYKRWMQFMTIMNEGTSNSTDGCSARTAVWKKNKAVLWYYPAAEKKYSTPILVVYSLFNQPFILDLQSGNSMIEGLTKRGYDVYMLDWGIPGQEDKELGLDDYIVDYLQRAVKRTLRHSSAEEITLLGYCLGGTFAAMYTAIANEPVKNLITATVPIDFSVQAGPDKWTEGTKSGVLNIGRLVDVYGNMPPAFVERMFKSITGPVYFTPYVSLLTRAHDDKFVKKWRNLDAWTKGHVPFAGKAFKQIANDFSRENKLIKGEMVIRGKQVDLSSISASLLVVSAKFDHLVPEGQSLPFFDLVKSKDKTYKLMEAGHISLALSDKFPALMDDWLKNRSTLLKEAK